MIDSRTANDKRDTNVGFHAPAENDAPATRWMIAILVLLLVLGSVVAVLAYNHYNGAAKYPPATEQPPPPLNP